MLSSRSVTRRPSAPSQGAARSAQLMLVCLVAGVLLGLLDDVFGPARLAVVLAGLAVLAGLVVLWSRRPVDSLGRRLGSGVGIVLASAALGVALAAVGGLVGPLGMLLVPASLVTGAAILVRPVVAVAVVIVMLPFGLIGLPGDTLGLQVMQVVALLAVVVVLVGRLVRGQRPVSLSAPLMWAVALVAVGLLSTLSAVDLGIALRQLVQLAVGVALALVAVTVVRDLTTVRRLLWLLVAVASLSTLPALVAGQGFETAYGGAVVTGRLEGTFTQPNQFGSFTMVTLLLGIALALGARTARERALVVAALVPLGLGLLLSLSRSSWIGVVVGGLVLLLLLPSARRVLVLAGVPLLLVAASVGAFAPDEPQVNVVGARLSTLAEGSGGNPYDGRTRIWAEGVREVTLDPVTGHGPGSFVVVSTRSASDAQTIQAEHAHNVLLTVAAEYGLLGAALLVGLTVSCARAVRRGVGAARALDAPLVAGFGAAGAAIAAQGLVDYTMRNTVLFTFFWLLAGLAVASGRLAEQEASSASQRRPGAGAPAPV